MVGAFEGRSGVRSVRIRMVNLGRVLIFSSCCLETFIEGFKGNEERFQAVGREIEADVRGADNGEVDLCGVDTFSFGFD